MSEDIQDKMDEAMGRLRAAVSEVTAILYLRRDAEGVRMSSSLAFVLGVLHGTLAQEADAQESERLPYDEYHEDRVER